MAESADRKGSGWLGGGERVVGSQRNTLRERKQHQVLLNMYLYACECLGTGRNPAVSILARECHVPVLQWKKGWQSFHSTVRFAIVKNLYLAKEPYQNSKLSLFRIFLTCIGYNAYLGRLNLRSMRLDWHTSTSGVHYHDPSDAANTLTFSVWVQYTPLTRTGSVYILTGQLHIWSTGPAQKSDISRFFTEVFHWS